MKKLSKLRWVPMIVKAYIDARTQTLLENEKRIQTEPVTMPHLTESITNSNHHPTTPLLAPLPATQKKRARSTTQHSQVLSTVTPKSKGSYDLLYKELLEAKRKIHHLESLHREIGHVQSDLDHRLLEIAGHLRKHTTKHHSTKRHR